MNLYLILFTHLCVHVLGLMGKPLLALLFSIVALLAYWVHLVLIRAVWPGRILQDTLTRIKAMRARLHDEAARRRTVGMYHLSTDGLRGLVELEREVRDTIAAHRAHLNAPLSYACGVFSLCKRVRRCRRDVDALCQELMAKIQQFDGIGDHGHELDTDGVDDEEAARTASYSRDWLDPVLTTITDQVAGR
ncbi:hypothetical protein FB451DRAFT_1388368 [Mycena latifolia]|nr:hypothetical protein FB451DRAFT_1388368 [Mycena latifolia]